VEGDCTYSSKDIIELEATFMNELGFKSQRGYPSIPNEETLFNAFEKTLIHLRQIHESKGEVIENYSFKKRELVAV
jgi:hypothetical protein